MRRYFIDWEFIEDGRTIDPVSIGVVCDDGREFYAEIEEVNWGKANQWVIDNVRPHLTGNSWYTFENGTEHSFGDRLTKDEVAAELLRFTQIGDNRPEFWAYYGDYDWVTTCQLYGAMIDLPPHWPRFCMDIMQLSAMVGYPELPKQESIQHNALNDAKWNYNTYIWLHKYANNLAGGLYQK